MKKVASKFLSLNSFDWLKGLLVAALTGGLFAAQQMLTKVPPAIDWKEIGMAALAAAVAYLGKQLFTNSESKLGSEGSLLDK